MNSQCDFLLCKRHKLQPLGKTGFFLMTDVLNIYKYSNNDNLNSRVLKI